MKIIVSWNSWSARYYAVLRNWPPHSYKIVLDPQNLRGLGRGTDIYVLGEWHQYRFGVWTEFAQFLFWLTKNERAEIHYDSLDNWA